MKEYKFLMDGSLHLSSLLDMVTKCYYTIAAAEDIIKDIVLSDSCDISKSDNFSRLLIETGEYKKQYNILSNKITEEALSTIKDMCDIPKEANITSFEWDLFSRTAVLTIDEEDDKEKEDNKEKDDE